MIRKNLSITLIAAIASMFLAACSSSSKPVPPPIMVAMDTPPPSTIEIGLSTPLSAIVQNDSSNGGVLWTLNCDIGANCGTLTASSSASGNMIGYTAPSTIPEGDVPNGGMALTITATSATDSMAFATATVTLTVVSDTQLLFGNYAFYVQGFDANGFIYTAAGSVVLDGAGDVTGGEEDFFDSANATPSVGDVITGGSYLINQNGPGSLSINVALPGSPPVPDPTIGPGGNGTQTFSLVAVNNNHLLIEEFDSSATSLGSMDLQTFTMGDLSAVTGGFAYVVTGVEASGNPLGFGGVFSTDGAGGFSADQSDENDGGIVTKKITNQGGGFTLPDANGRGTFTIGTDMFAYYLVAPEALSLVEIDGTQLTVGVALGQGAASGTFAPTSVGPAAFGASGFTDGSANIAGQFATDDASLLTSGFGDTNELLGPIGTGSITGTYALASNGYGNFAITGGDLIVSEGDITTFGMYAIDPAVTVVDPNNPAGGGGALLLNLDSAGSLGGVLAPQTDPTDVFNSNNAISFGGEDSTGPIDLVGQYLSDGVSNLTGTGDQNEINGSGLSQGISLAGTFAADPNNPGRSTVALTINGAATPNNIVTYQASPSLNFNLDVDPGFSTSGTIQSQ
jgi:hypothetical protein